MSQLSIHPVALPLEPAELFAHLAHLPGSVFLDTSNAQSSSEAISLVAFAPESLCSGHLSAPDALDNWMRRHQLGDLPDYGFPTGGAMGSIDYDGAFTFGLYRRLLVYQHQSRTWIDVGGLAQDLPDLTGDPPQPFSCIPDFQPEMDQATYLHRVLQAKAYIAAGDIYQINLTRRFSSPWTDGASAYPLYQELRSVSPVSYAAYLNLGNRRILSSSPEQFLHMSGQQIQTRPIKGTRPRFRDPERDERSRYDLLTSEKELAELIMITDLERNDLGQICEFGTVHATDLLKLEAYEQVFHLVSTVQGRLRPELSQLDALRACFPGGSITGAPKKRAREIIAELETTPRGLYTGAIGYLGLNGESQFNIAIRTVVEEAGCMHFHVGAGIVADSSPALEFEETQHKAAGILQSVAMLGNNSAFSLQPHGKE